MRAAPGVAVARETDAAINRASTAHNCVAVSMPACDPKAHKGKAHGTAESIVPACDDSQPGEGRCRVRFSRLSSSGASAARVSHAMIAVEETFPDSISAKAAAASACIIAFRKLVAKPVQAAAIASQARPSVKVLAEVAALVRVVSLDSILLASGLSVPATAIRL
ncbi:hypothetical protein GCM10017612_43360 [Novosphingobium resinovorum]|nr:hypothetical protein GCM10017612_43360 [Novosphingobium resinovorum]